MTRESTIRRNVELNKADVEWFEEQYAGGSLSWLLSLLLEKYRQANEKTPAFYAELAASQLSAEVHTTS